MTDDRMAPRALLEKGPDTDLLREMIGFVASQLMECEAESLCGAGRDPSQSGSTCRAARSSYGRTARRGPYASW